MGYKHVWTSFSEEAPCSAKDWLNGMGDWIEHFEHLRPDFPNPIARGELAPGARKGVYPLTRHLHADKGKLPPEMRDAMPDIFVETLVFLDAEAGSAMYHIADNSLGMRNYYSFVEAAPLAADRCRITFTSRVDLPEEMAEDELIALFREAYRVLIVGTADYANKKAAGEL